jgi:hypothetical protein
MEIIVTGEFGEENEEENLSAGGEELLVVFLVVLISSVCGFIFYFKRKRINFVGITQKMVITTTKTNNKRQNRKQRYNCV